MVGIGTIVAAFALKAIPKLERYALVLVVFLGTALVAVLNIDTLLISDEATIPTGLAALPIPTGWRRCPTCRWCRHSCSARSPWRWSPWHRVPAYDRPSRIPMDRGRARRETSWARAWATSPAPSSSRRPTGGSLSRTAVSADGGSTSRVAGYVAAATVVLLVVVFGTFVGAIPEAVIGGLLFVIGVELVMGRMPDARLAWRTGMTSRVLFAITLALTLTVPLQWAIIGGAVLSLLAFVVSSASRVDLHRATRDDIGWRLSDDVPATLPEDEPIVLRYDGPNFFADVAGFADRLPEPDPHHPGVLVMDLGALEHFSSTTLKSLGKMHAKFAAFHSGLVLTGVEANARDVLARTGLLAQTRRAERPADRSPHRVAASTRVCGGARRCCRSSGRRGPEGRASSGSTSRPRDP